LADTADNKAYGAPFVISYAASRILDAYPGLNPDQVEDWLANFSFASTDDRFVFLAIPKAACTAMKILLRGLRESAPPLRLFAGPNRESRRDMFVHARENVPFPSLNALGNEEQRHLMEAADVFRFAIVRNPYTRLISAWRDKVYLCEPSVDNVYGAIRGDTPAMDHKRPIELAEFVSYLEKRERSTCNRHWREQVLLTFPKAIRLTHIGKVENLAATMALFSSHLGRQQSLTVTRANEGSVRPLTLINPELAKRIYAVYQEDFLTFGYDADSWPRDEQSSASVNVERFVDEIIERNLVIAHLYGERDRLTGEMDRLKSERNQVHRFSIAGAKDKLRHILKSQRRR
jgi:hypothetical protein